MKKASKGIWSSSSVLGDTAEVQEDVYGFKTPKQGNHLYYL